MPHWSMCSALLPNDAGTHKGELWSIYLASLIGYSIYLDAGLRNINPIYFPAFCNFSRLSTVQKDNRCVLDEISLISGLQR